MQSWLALELIQSGTRKFKQQFPMMPVEVCDTEEQIVGVSVIGFRRVHDDVCTALKTHDLRPIRRNHKCLKPRVIR